MAQDSINKEETHHKADANLRDSTVLENHSTNSTKFTFAQNSDRVSVVSVEFCSTDDSTNLETSSVEQEDENDSDDAPPGEGGIVTVPQDPDDNGGGGAWTLQDGPQ